jgi:hypothetical protein
MNEAANDLDFCACLDAYPLCLVSNGFTLVLAEAHSERQTDLLVMPRLISW